MIKLLIITVIVVFLMRSLFRLMYPRIPDTPPVIGHELKPCEYCGTLVRLDKAKQKRGRLFCSAAHQAMYFS